MTNDQNQTTGATIEAVQGADVAPSPTIENPVESAPATSESTTTATTTTTERPRETPTSFTERKIREVEGKVNFARTLRGSNASLTATIESAERWVGLAKKAVENGVEKPIRDVGGKLKDVLSQLNTAIDGIFVAGLAKPIEVLAGLVKRIGERNDSAAEVAKRRVTDPVFFDTRPWLDLLAKANGAVTSGKAPKGLSKELWETVKVIQRILDETCRDCSCDLSGHVVQQNAASREALRALKPAERSALTHEDWRGFPIKTRCDECFRYEQDLNLADRIENGGNREQRSGPSAAQRSRRAAKSLRDSADRTARKGGGSSKKGKGQ